MYLKSGCRFLCPSVSLSIWVCVHTCSVHLIIYSDGHSKHCLPQELPNSFGSGEEIGFFSHPNHVLHFFSYLAIKTILQLQAFSVNKTPSGRGPQYLWHHPLVCVATKHGRYSLQFSSLGITAVRSSIVMWWQTFERVTPVSYSCNYYFFKTNVRNRNTKHFPTFQKVLCAPWSTF